LKADEYTNKLPQAWLLGLHTINMEEAYCLLKLLKQINKKLLKVLGEV